MDRRDFLKSTGRAGAGLALGSLPLIQGCKGGGSTTPDEPQTPVSVTLRFNVYNHTQGLRASFSVPDVKSGTALSLSASKLIADYGINDVNANRIVLRNAPFGLLQQYSPEGTVNLVAPRQDSDYSVFLLNSSPQELYSQMFSQKVGPRGRVIGVYRRDFDGQSGEERVWQGALLPETGDYGVFDQLNAALNPVWAPFSYGSFTIGQTGGSFSYGYGNSNGLDGWCYLTEPTWPSYVTVNSNRVTDIPSQVAIGMAMVIEGIWGANRLNGQPTYQSIQTNGVLNQSARDFFAALFVIS